MIAQGIEAIRHCESRLRELMAQASADGQYETVATLMGWAKAIAAVVASPLENPTSSQVAPVSEIAGSDAIRLATPFETRRPRSTRVSRMQYPRFARYRNELVKTGWSKKEKKEYQHRAPRGIVDLLVARLDRFRGKDFTSDELLPLADDDGQEVPSYQAYLCLAWLREAGMIVKNGRHGYFMDGTVDLKAAVEQHWQQLKQQR
jgi:hypothetical protein